MFDDIWWGHDWTEWELPIKAGFESKPGQSAQGPGDIPGETKPMGGWSRVDLQLATGL